MNEVGQRNGDFDVWDSRFLIEMRCFGTEFYGDIKEIMQQIYLQLYNL